jgi:hypothetical protein
MVHVRRRGARDERLAEMAGTLPEGVPLDVAAYWSGRDKRTIERMVWEGKLELAPPEVVLGRPRKRIKLSSLIPYVLLTPQAYQRALAKHEANCRRIAQYRAKQRGQVHTPQHARRTTTTVDTNDAAQRATLDTGLTPNRKLSPGSVRQTTALHGADQCQTLPMTE